MFHYLKALLGILFCSNPKPTNQISHPVTTVFTLESLWNNFESRTWEYRFLKDGPNHFDLRLLNWIGSMDRSGYTREKCLRFLIANFISGDENRILLRLADWVPKVQVLARWWILGNFGSLPIESIYANQALILFLGGKPHLREDPGLIEITSNLLERTRSIDLQNFEKFSNKFRRFLYTLSLSGDGYLRKWILNDSDPFNRLLLLNWVEIVDLSENEIQKIKKEKLLIVRHKFYLKLFNSNIKPTKGDLQNLVLDRNQSLRGFARFHLQKLYQEDAYEIYQSRHDEKFYYIADYGRKEDSEHFLEGIRVGSESTKYNCLKALVSSAPERILELDLRPLIFKSGKYQSILIEVLPKFLPVEGIEALRPAFEASSQNGILSYLWMLKRKSFWVFIDEALDVLISNPCAFKISNRIINKICESKSVYERISERIRARINNKINKLREGPPNQYGEFPKLLEFILKTATPENGTPKKISGI